MRWLITGGAGFIGSHLADACVAAGDSVDILDDLSTGSVENVVDHQPLNVGSITDEALVRRLARSADIVVHLAAVVGVRRVLERPTETIRVNVSGTETVLSAIDAVGGRRTIIASTSEVYGLSENIPFRESDPLMIGSSGTARWAYACGKLLDEFLAIAYANERSMPVTAVRLFNTTGPRQTGRYGMVVPTLVRQAMQGVPMTVFGDGRQRRCFTHVSDVVWALRKIATTDSTVGQVYNIGSTQETSIMDLARKIGERVCGDSFSFSLIPYEKAYGSASGFEDSKRRVPCLDKAMQAFGYKPKKTLEEIIDDIAAHERAKRQAA